MIINHLTIMPLYPDVSSKSITFVGNKINHITTTIGTNDLFNVNIELHPLITGVIFYSVGLLALTAWEKIVVPQLKLNSILPDIPITNNQLTESQKNEPWIVPLTADYSIPLPDKQELEIKGKHRIGSKNGISQFITLDNDLKIIKKIQEQSKEWSELYHDKKNKWN